MALDDDLEARIARELWNNPGKRRFDWISETGEHKAGVFPAEHCVFCKYCSKILYDSIGPWRYFCYNAHADTAYGDAGKCWYFAEA